MQALLRSGPCCLPLTGTRSGTGTPRCHPLLALCVCMQLVFSALQLAVERDGRQARKEKEKNHDQSARHFFFSSPQLGASPQLSSFPCRRSCSPACRPTPTLAMPRGVPVRHSPPCPSVQLDAHLKVNVTRSALLSLRPLIPAPPTAARAPPAEEQARKAGQHRVRMRTREREGGSDWTCRDWVHLRDVLKRLFSHFSASRSRSLSRAAAQASHHSSTSPRFSLSRAPPQLTSLLSILLPLPPSPFSHPSPPHPFPHFPPSLCRGEAASSDDAPTQRDGHNAATASKFDAVNSKDQQEMVGSAPALRLATRGTPSSHPSAHLGQTKVAKIVRLFIFKHAQGESIKRKGACVPRRHRFRFRSPWPRITSCLPACDRRA